MRYRTFRQVSTGKFLDWSVGAGERGNRAGEFSTPMESHRRDVAAAWGIPEADLEEVILEALPTDVNPVAGKPDRITHTPPPSPPTPRDLAIKRLRDELIPAMPSPMREAWTELLAKVL